MNKPKKRQMFQFTPEQEKLFNLVTVPGTNVNSNTTVGETARKTGVQALNFLVQEAARKDAEIESRSDRKTVKRLTTVGERLRGDNGYSSYMSAGTPMSGRDPALGTIFDWTVGAKGIDALGKTALWNYAKYVPTSGLGRWGRNYFTNQALKEGIKDFGRNLSNRLYIENAGKYTLFNQFGDDIGTLLTTEPLTSEAKGKGIAMVASKNGGHKVSEDLYNIAVLDSKELGYQGLESGHDLFRPNLTMHVTDKFPKVERPNVSLLYIDGKYLFAPSSTQPPIRLLIGTTERPQPNFIQELTNHRIDLGALRNLERIKFNEATGNFEEIPMVSAPEPSTSLKFFKRPTYLSPLELAGDTKWERNFTPRWHVAKYPGYLLKGLMGGSPLERLLSKNGTINVNQLNAYFNKASQIEREVANKVLTEKFAGQKTIDYNLFKKAVLDELINYNTKPQMRYSTYGMDRLGFNTIKEPDGSGGIIEYLPGIRTNTFTFESPKIPVGSNKHYDITTLGHSRTYITPEEPKVLHVMESLSDWGQSHIKMMPSVLTHQVAIEKALKSGNINAFHSFTNRLSSLMRDKLTKYERMALENINKEIESGLPSGFLTVEDLWNKKYEILKKASNRSNIGVLGLHLHDNYLQRQLQENLRYAAENGLTKMRYPTSETAAKIEGYLKTTPNLSELEKIYIEKFNKLLLDMENTYGRELIWNNPSLKELWESLVSNKEALERGTNFTYSPEHQTILKKYADFPKLFLKLYRGLNVRTVTDAKGNTWYEVDVPKGYLSREWLFKQGGKMNLEFLKNGSGIHIKKKNRGKFTLYCGGKVTDACIRRAKASGNPTLVKRATFAQNSRSWSKKKKHSNGGILTINGIKI